MVLLTEARSNPGLARFWEALPSFPPPVAPFGTGARHVLRARLQKKVLEVHQGQSGRASAEVLQ